MICAILLAAGTSSRMGPSNKLLLDVGNGQPLVRTMAERLAGAPFDEVVVVTGFESGDVKCALEGLPVRIIENPAYESGMTTSIIAGLRAIAPHAHFLVGLSDMPLLTAKHYKLLLAEFEAALIDTAHPIVKPSLNGVPGNPAIFHAVYREEVLSLTDLHAGCKPVLQHHADSVIHPKGLPDVFFLDMDRPEEYQEMRMRMNREG